MACSPATPAPITKAFPGGMLPAAVVIMASRRGNAAAPSSTALVPETVACDESTSMDCARVMRGTRSRASAVTRRSARAWRTAFPSTSGSKLMSTEPVSRKAISSGEGGCTFTTVAAPAHAARALSTSTAPASAYAPSATIAVAPAPRSTATSTPALMSFAAASGSKATRRSRGAVSLGTPIRMAGARDIG